MFALATSNTLSFVTETDKKRRALKESALSIYYHNKKTQAQHKYVELLHQEAFSKRKNDLKGKVEGREGGVRGL